MSTLQTLNRTSDQPSLTRSVVTCLWTPAGFWDGTVQEVSRVRGFGKREEAIRDFRNIHRYVGGITTSTFGETDLRVQRTCERQHLIPL